MSCSIPTVIADGRNVLAQQDTAEVKVTLDVMTNVGLSWMSLLASLYCDVYCLQQAMMIIILKH